MFNLINDLCLEFQMDDVCLILVDVLLILVL
jgi:hypothetical protein